MTLGELRHVIGVVLDSMGVDSWETRVTKGGWWLSRGSVSGMIIASGGSDDAPGILTVAFIVMPASVSNPLALYRKLLELNMGLMGVSSFAIDNSNNVTLTASRIGGSIGGIGGVRDLIEAVSGMADRYDNELIAEFA